MNPVDWRIPTLQRGLIDFDHAPSSVQHPGSGYRPPTGGPYSTCRTPISGHVRFHLLPSPQWIFLPPLTPGHRTVGHSWFLICRMGPLFHLPLPQLPKGRNSVLRILICYRLFLWSTYSYGLCPTVVTVNPGDGDGVTVHWCQPFTNSVHTVASVPPTAGLGYDH